MLVKGVARSSGISTSPQVIPPLDEMALIWQKSSFFLNIIGLCVVLTTLMVQQGPLLEPVVISSLTLSEDGWDRF